MLKRTASGMMLTLLLAGVLTLASSIRTAKASGTIYIRADGSIDPSTAPIQRDGDVYTFIDDVYDEIVVQRSNIIVDGKGYTLQGPEEGEGFYLYGISNVTIQNTSVKKWWYGILLVSSSFNNFSGNHITNNGYGIYVFDSDDNNIVNNNVSSNLGYGMYIDSSSRNTFVNNTVNSGFGFYIKQSSYSTLRNNSIDSNEVNFGVYGHSKSQYVHDIDNSNTIKGRPIYYWVDEQDRKIPVDASFVGLVGCLNITVQNLNLTDDNNRGIILAYTTNSTVENNFLMNNWWGFTLVESSHNTIRNNTAIDNYVAFVVLSNSGNIVRNNTVAGNTMGVYSFDSADTIDDNLIERNGEWGIFLSSSSGNEVRNNNVTKNKNYGIHLENSNNNTISGNNITRTHGDYGFGVYVRSSNNNIISDNEIKNNWMGIDIRDSQNNIIESNLVFNRDTNIYLLNSGDNTLRNNNMTTEYWLNFGVEGSILAHFIQDIDTSNTVNGRPIHYLVNEQNLIIEPRTYPSVGYLGVINSTNIRVENLKLEKNRQGILFAYTNKSSIQNVKVVNNRFGIEFVCSSNNSISGNNITRNHNGVRLEFSDNNTISNNTMKNSWYSILFAFSNHNMILNNHLLDSFEGIWLYTSDYNKIIDNYVFVKYERPVGIELSYSNQNLIYHNTVINYRNGAKAKESYDNIWDDGITGNYWDDYNGTDNDGDGIGDTPYTIDEFNKDRYPLMNPWTTPNIAVMNVTPSKTIIGQGFTSKINVTVVNHGNKIETFNVTVYANTTFITSQTTTLMGRNSTTITFTWNTTSFAKGNYIIKAYATPVPYEKDTTDNTLRALQQVQITIPGDVNGNGEVNKTDVMLIIAIYRCKQDDSEYRPNSDLLEDGAIDISDVVMCTANYGEKDRLGPLRLTASSRTSAFKEKSCSQTSKSKTYTNNFPHTTLLESHNGIPQNKRHQTRYEPGFEYACTHKNYMPFRKRK